MACQSQSVFEDLIGLMAKMPWWIGVISALFSYVGLHLYAIQPLPQPSGVGLIGEFVVTQLLQTLALFGQYILPFAFLLGAIVSGINSLKRKIRRLKEAGRDDDHCIVPQPTKQYTSKHPESVSFVKTPKGSPSSHPGHILIAEKPDK